MSAEGSAPELRVLELFCGIGGCAAALGGAARVTAAIDVNTEALAVYGANFRHPAEARNLDSIDRRDLARWRADLWWMSPPCQPFTRRGKRLDDADPRSTALLALIPKIAAERPPFVALENVPGFAGSRTHGRLLAALEGAGYEVRERELCPTELGVPNRRRRYYLVAGRQALAATGEAATRDAPRPLAAYLDDEPEAGLELDPAIAQSYRAALDVVDPADPAAVAACFTSAYGRSHVRSGSYLRTPHGPRRFSPREILSLLGFPKAYVVPSGTPRRLAWRLAGASLSVQAVRRTLEALPLSLGRAEGERVAS